MFKKLKLKRETTGDEGDFVVLCSIPSHIQSPENLRLAKTCPQIVSSSTKICIFA